MIRNLVIGGDFASLVDHVYVACEEKSRTIAGSGRRASWLGWSLVIHDIL